MLATSWPPLTNSGKACWQCDGLHKPLCQIVNEQMHCHIPPHLLLLVPSQVSATTTHAAAGVHFLKSVSHPAPLSQLFLPALASMPFCLPDGCDSSMVNRMLFRPLTRIKAGKELLRLLVKVIRLSLGV